MGDQIKLQLEKWRGYSAYEVAVKNGFNGTEKEWLESLGADLSVTVNGRQVDDTGNITVTGEHMLVVTDGQKTVAQKFDELDDEKVSIADLANNLTTTEEGKALDARQGKALSDKIAASKATATASLTAAGWTGSSSPYTQTVNVTGVTASNTVIVTPAPASHAKYTDSVVYCSAQAEGKLTFKAVYKPTAALTANVLILN